MLRIVAVVAAVLGCAQAFVGPPPFHGWKRAHTTTTTRLSGSLTPFEYYVIKLKGTEPAWSSPLNDEKRAGEYRCKNCGTVLFDSSTKFESGTGWPSFFDARAAVERRRDFGFNPILGLLLAAVGVPSLLQQQLPSIPVLLVGAASVALYGLRTEVVCRNCGGHLGHVFADGPRPTGQRYCCNGASLSFSKKTNAVDSSS